MPTYRHPVGFRRLSAPELDAWREYPAALVADCLNRSQFMDSGIKPLAQGRGLIGQARTVTTMAGDNGPNHLALAELVAGEVLVIDAGGITEVAVWGGILCRAAMARGAGEVAPLMLVGAVKVAPELPLSMDAGDAFGVHRSFMHLGYHIFDLGFHSPNAEAAKPMVYTTTLLLISIVAILNITAIWLRNRLRRKFVANHF